ncbi:YfzA family protein [Shouchella lonarensis]|uniref:YfzA-like protein n=1 Tax=Shouchella lonarensis TaxID=1464122 RepID=A0A1G6NAP6_9BACI|nr:YfzA family protein [Shouchella lonarensis]SDC64920.1 YfzA-like protein [Shouchella lonarensis]
MTEINHEVDYDKEERLPWIIWLGLFILLQIVFMVMEYFSWSLIGPGKVAEKLAHFIRLGEWFHVYQSLAANLATLILGVILLINGIFRLTKKAWGE